jgi:hypothetical protein
MLVNTGMMLQLLFFLLLCLGETLMTLSHALDSRTADEARELGK